MLLCSLLLVFFVLVMVHFLFAKAEMSSLIDYAPVTNEEGLETSILGLHFRASSSHLKHGLLKLRCTATIAAVYYRENTRVAAARPNERSRRPESHGIFAGNLFYFNS